MGVHLVANIFIGVQCDCYSEHCSTATVTVGQGAFDSTSWTGYTTGSSFYSYRY